MDKTKYEATTNDELTAREEAYFKDLVLDYINNMEDLTEDERIVNASDKEIDELAERVISKVITDPEIWNAINDSIEYYIYHDQKMIDASKKI